MAKRTKIYTKCFSDAGGLEYINLALKLLQDDVDALLLQYPDANVQWMQSSGTTSAQMSTRLTAIVTYSEDESGGRPAPTDPPSGGNARP